MNNQDLKKAGTLYFIGNLFNKGIAFLTVPIFTRILSTTDYGIVNTYNSWVAILNMVIGCALTMGVRASFIDYEKETDGFIASIVKFTFSVTIGVSLFAGLIAFFLPINRIYVLLVVLCCLHGGFWAILDDYLQYLMMKYKYKERTILMILPNLIALSGSIAIILLFLTSEKYLGRIITTSIVYILFGLFVIYINSKKKVSIEKKKEYIKYGLSVSAPLILHGIALNLLSQSDRTMITWLADASQTGIYSLIYNFSMIATVITTSLDGLWIPSFIDSLKKREIEDINEKVTWYIALMTCSMVCLVLVGPEIVKILAPDSYWEGISIIPPIVLANYLIFCYSLYVNTEHFHKKTKSIAAYTVIAAVFNLITNYIFIPQYGYVAAAYTTLASYIVALVLHANKAIHLEPNVLPIKKFASSFVFVCIGTVLFYVFQENWLIRWSIAFAFLAYSIVRYKGLLISLFSRNKK